MLQSLSDKLKAIFDDYKGANKPFVEVYDYHTLETTGFPYLTFEPISREAVVSDTCTNLRTYTYQVLIFQEITETGWRNEAKEILIKWVDEIITALDKDYTLSNTVNMVKPVAGTITPYVTQWGKAMVAEITVDIEVFADIK